MVSLDFPNVHTYITLGISSNHATTCEIWGKKKKEILHWLNQTGILTTKQTLMNKMILSMVHAADCSCNSWDLWHRKSSTRHQIILQRQLIIANMCYLQGYKLNMVIILRDRKLMVFSRH